MKKIRRKASIVLLLAAAAALAFQLLRPPLRYLEAGILVCERPADENFKGFDYENVFLPLLDQLEASYAESPDLDLQVISLVSSNPGGIDESGTAALASLAEENPQHRNAAVYLLNACISFPELPVCTTQIADRAVSLDRDNALVWALVASFRYAQGNSYGAAVALDRVNSAPFFNDYFQEQLALIKTAVPETSEFYRGQLLGPAFNHGVSMLIDAYPSMKPLQDMCAQQTSSNPRLANACLTFGDRLAEQASSLAGISMGEGIQYSAHIGQGNQIEARRVDQQGRNRYREMAGREARLASNLRDYDGQLFEYWYDQVVFNGEGRSIASLVTEVKRRSSDASYNPCPGTRFSNSLANIRDLTGW